MKCISVQCSAVTYGSHHYSSVQGGLGWGGGGLLRLIQETGTSNALHFLGYFATNATVTVQWILFTELNCSVHIGGFHVKV